MVPSALIRHLLNECTNCVTNITSSKLSVESKGGGRLNSSGVGKSFPHRVVSSNFYKHREKEIDIGIATDSCDLLDLYVELTDLFRSSGTVSIHGFSSFSQIRFLFFFRHSLPRKNILHGNTEVGIRCWEGGQEFPGGERATT